MSTKDEMLKQIEELKTRGDCARFRIDVLQTLTPSEDTRAIRSAFREKMLGILQTERKQRNTA